MNAARAFTSQLPDLTGLDFIPDQSICNIVTSHCNMQEGYFKLTLF